jgi:hypothetical protein
MTIVLRVFGNLIDYFGGSIFYIQLPEGASLGDLLDSISRRWGGVLPANIWIEGEKRFTPVVLLTDGKGEFNDDICHLSDKQVISITLPMSGG